MLDYPAPFMNKVQNIINAPGYSGAKVEFMWDFEHLMEWARWGGQLGEQELTLGPGFRRMEAHAPDTARIASSSSVKSLRSSLAGDTLHGSSPNDMTSVET